MSWSQHYLNDEGCDRGPNIEHICIIPGIFEVGKATLGHLGPVIQGGIENTRDQKASVALDILVFVEENINLVNVNYEDQHIEKVHLTSKNMVSSSKAVPLKLDELLERPCPKYF